MGQMSPLEHVIYKLRNATIHDYPFPHFYQTEVFPWDFYGDLLASIQDTDKYAPLGKLQHRQAMDANELIAPFDCSYFGTQMMMLFGPKAFYERYPSHGRPNFSQEFRFIRDEEGYSIGPHTDTPRKVLSLLFYLPETDGYRDCGTGIYVPDDHKKTCVGGPHHPFEGFSEVWRAPYMPNSCLGFWKTANSWHAVEKITRKIRRDVLLFNIYEEKEEKSPIFVSK
jgi:hypothetical protein